MSDKFDDLLDKIIKRINIVSVSGIDKCYIRLRDEDTMKKLFTFLGDEGIIAFMCTTKQEEKLILIPSNQWEFYRELIRKETKQ